MVWVPGSLGGKLAMNCDWVQPLLCAKWVSPATGCRVAFWVELEILLRMGLLGCSLEPVCQRQSKDGNVFCPVISRE